jgi:hypothetical protein
MLGNDIDAFVSLSLGITAWQELVQLARLPDL